MQNSIYHDSNSIELGRVSLEQPLTMQRSRPGLIGLCIRPHANYKFSAYPGPEIVQPGTWVRIEHLPLHFHVTSESRRFRELRIKTEDFTEYDGLLIPRDLRDFLKDKEIREYLVRNTESVFYTGRKADQTTPCWN